MKYTYEISEEDARHISDKLREIMIYCKIGDEQTIRNAIIEVEKNIPKLVIEEKWNPDHCPTCWADLSESCYDGYYKNPHYEICPVCRQRLKYR